MIEAAHGSAGRTQAPARRDSVDFWRGVVLCTIFVNHVPGNVFERFTYRNFGLSDSAEAFVFISGVALALAYGRRFAAGPVAPPLLRIARRAVRLYGVHLFLSVIGVAIFAVGSLAFADDGLMQMHGRDLVVDDPWAALVGMVSMGHQFGYFNILPLYVLLVAFAPLLLLLARFGRPAMLLASVALYAVARVAPLNIPTWPMRGEWFFDPFAWQLLLAIGLACGLASPPSKPNRLLLIVSGAVVAGGLVVATDAFGQIPGLFDAWRARGDLDKTMLGLGRLTHFLALAYLLAGWHVADRLRRLPLVFAPMATIGRHGLTSFVLLSLLAAAAQVVTAGVGHTPALDALIVGTGLAAIYGLARLIEAMAHTDRLPTFTARLSGKAATL